MKISLFVLALGLAIGCNSKKAEKLPYLGRFEIVKGNDGKIDTLYHTVSDFSFTNQLGEEVNLESIEGKIYITDFFFTTCPDICPTMKAQMIRVYDKYREDDDIIFLSHTIDPKHDSVEVLLDYAENLGIDHKKWIFLTGDKSKIYKQGQVSYMAAIVDDPNTGLSHSGHFFLIDKERRVRGAFDGTDPVKVNDLMQQIDILKDEYKP